jgi:hypothetical protein
MAIFKANEALKYNDNDPGTQNAQIGSKILEIQQNIGMNEAAVSISPLVAVEYTVAADATGGLAICTMPYAAEVVDVIVFCTTSNTSGTLTLKKATNSISDAIACVTAGAIGRAATLATAYYILASGDILNVVANGAADRGKIIVILRKV